MFSLLMLLRSCEILQKFNKMFGDKVDSFELQDQMNANYELQIVSIILNIISVLNIKTSCFRQIANLRNQVRMFKTELTGMDCFVMNYSAVASVSINKMIINMYLPTSNIIQHFVTFTGFGFNMHIHSIFHRNWHPFKPFSIVELKNIVIIYQIDSSGAWVLILTTSWILVQLSAI